MKKHVLVFSIILVVLLAPATYAYTDPGSGMLIWQMVVAGVMGLGFFFYKIKNRIISIFKGKKDDK